MVKMKKWEIKVEKRGVLNTLSHSIDRSIQHFLSKQSQWQSGRQNIRSIAKQYDMSKKGMCLIKWRNFGLF